MTENQNDQKAKSTQNGTQISPNPNTQKKENITADKSADKSTVKEDEKVKPTSPAESKEQDSPKHPNETSAPVSSPNKSGAGL